MAGKKSKEKIAVTSRPVPQTPSGVIVKLHGHDLCDRCDSLKVEAFFKGILFAVAIILFFGILRRAAGE